MFDAADLVYRFLAAGDADLLAQIELSSIHENFFYDRKHESVAFLALRDRSIENATNRNVLNVVLVLKEAGVAKLIGFENFR